MTRDGGRQAPARGALDRWRLATAGTATVCPAATRGKAGAVQRAAGPAAHSSAAATPADAANASAAGSRASGGATISGRGSGPRGGGRAAARGHRPTLQELVSHTGDTEPDKSQYWLQANKLPGGDNTTPMLQHSQIILSISYGNQSRNTHRSSHHCLFIFGFQ